MAFGEMTTCEEVLEGIDLSDKRVLITGGSSGLGEETARALASKGAEVIIAARDIEKANSVVDKIRGITGNTQFSVLQVDLSDPVSVRKATAVCSERYDSLDILINNAGIMACPLTRTAEGWECQLATNHFGHFLFTCELVGLLRNGSSARVINLTSDGHRMSEFDFIDPHFHSKKYDKWLAYGQAKTANALFTIELNRRLSTSGITANAVHPGVVKTGLGKHLAQEDLAYLARLPGKTLEFNTLSSGAATTVWAATTPDLNGKGGLYLEDCQIAKVVDAPFGNKGVAPYAVDQKNAAFLWKLTEETLGQKYDLN